MAEFYALHDADKAPELAQALGEMLLAWNRAEEIQAQAMAAMLCIDLNDAIVLYQKYPNFRSRTQVIYSLIGLRPEFEGIRTAVEKLSGLSKTRNRYVHCTFLQDADDPKSLFSIDYGELEGSPNRTKPTKAADIGNHTRAVTRRAAELLAALKKIPHYQVWSKDAALAFV